MVRANIERVGIGYRQGVRQVEADVFGLGVSEADRLRRATGDDVGDQGVNDCEGVGEDVGYHTSGRNGVAQGDRIERQNMAVSLDYGIS